ncbi:MAG: hypothetical protein R2754_11530 [Microthrixaceae bacterium]
MLVGLPGDAGNISGCSLSSPENRSAATGNDVGDVVVVERSEYLPFVEWPVLVGFARSRCQESLIAKFGSERREISSGSQFAAIARSSRIIKGRPVRATKPLCEFVHRGREPGGVGSKLLTTGMKQATEGFSTRVNAPVLVPRKRCL